MDWYLRIQLKLPFAFHFCLFPDLKKMDIVLEKSIVSEITDQNHNEDILPISEVKPCSAGLILGWVTAGELHVARGV